MRWAYAAIVTVLATAAASADVVGRVMSGGRPVQAASVVVPGTKFGASTDSCGWFRIAGDFTGMRIRAAALGYEPAYAVVASQSVVNLELGPMTPWGRPQDCDTLFMAPYLTGDRQRPPLPPHTFLIDDDEGMNSARLHFADPARHTRPWGYLETERRTERCTLHVHWALRHGRSGNLSVLDDRQAPRAILASRVNGEGRYEWTGGTDHGSLPPGWYELVLASRGDTLRLDFLRWRWPRPNCDSLPPR